MTRWMPSYPLILSRRCLPSRTPTSHPRQHRRGRPPRPAPGLLIGLALEFTLANAARVPRRQPALPGHRTPTLLARLGGRAPHAPGGGPSTQHSPPPRPQRRTHLRPRGKTYPSARWAHGSQREPDEATFLQLQLPLLASLTCLSQHDF